MSLIAQWFEIAVVDAKRAVQFYTDVIGLKPRLMEGSEDYWILGVDEATGFGGALYLPKKDESCCEDSEKKSECCTDSEKKSECCTDSAEKCSCCCQPNTVVYFEVAPDVASIVEKAVAVGSKVIMPRTEIGTMGVIAIVTDSEGNAIGLHAMA